MSKFINKIHQRLLGYVVNIPLIPRAFLALFKSLREPHLRQGLAEVRRLQRQGATGDGSKYLHLWIWLIDNAFRVVRLSLDRRPTSRTSISRAISSRCSVRWGTRHRELTSGTCYLHSREQSFWERYSVAWHHG